MRHWVVGLLPKFLLYFTHQLIYPPMPSLTEMSITSSQPRPNLLPLFNHKHTYISALLFPCFSPYVPDTSTHPRKGEAFPSLPKKLAGALLLLKPMCMVRAGQCLTPAPSMLNAAGEELWPWLYLQVVILEGVSRAGHPTSRYLKCKTRLSALFSDERFHPRVW